MSSQASNPFSLDGRVAIITGGGTGLGLGIAKCFVAAGAKVVLTGRRADVLEQACDQLGQAATYEVFDVTQTDEAPALVEKVTRDIGDVTTIVNNAGVHLKKPAVETQTDEFEAVLRTHLSGTLALSRAAAPAMLDRGSGSHLFIASMTSYLGIPQVIAYAAAKSAVVGMVRTLASEWSPRGVRINAIAPGWIDSPMLQKALSGDEARKNKILSRIMMEKFGDPDDIGHTATFLCSDAANYITGAVLPVDGGASVGF